jgi:hypothetical protein
MRYALSAASAWLQITFQSRFERLPRRANARQLTGFEKQIPQAARRDWIAFVLPLSR